MIAYNILKALHVITAVLSIAGFIVRGIWMMQSSPRLQQRWVKIAPHVNDTILLVSAIILVVLTAQYPGPVAWINAKIIGLLVYIVLGTIALKRGRTLQTRVIAWGLALVVFAYIAGVAFTRNIFPI